MVSDEKSAVIQIGVPLWVMRCFSLAAFKISSLSFFVRSLIMMCLGMHLVLAYLAFAWLLDL